MSLPDDFEFQRAEAERRVREMNKQYNEKINKYSKSANEKAEQTLNKSENGTSNIKNSDTLLILCLILLLSSNRDNFSLLLALLYIIS